MSFTCVLVHLKLTTCKADSACTYIYIYIFFQIKDPVLLSRLMQAKLCSIKQEAGLMDRGRFSSNLPL